MKQNLHTGGALPFEIDKAVSKGDIEAGIQSGVNHLAGESEAAKPDDRFHSTKYLLRQYRRVAYAVKISEEDLNLRVEMAHGTSFSPTEVNAALAGIDLSNTKLEAYTTSLIRSQNMLRIIQRALETVREDPDDGERLYQILFVTYFKPQKPIDRNAILDELGRLGFPMSVVTYHTHLKKAIYAMDRILWGYTARDCMGIIKKFLGEFDQSR